MKELKSSTSEHAVAVPWTDKMNNHVNSIDRRNNVIMFGLEEKSLIVQEKTLRVS